MKQIQLGKSPLMASQIGLGFFREQPTDDVPAKELLETALELGINFFEHADIYGGGECESLFGRIKDESKRQDMILQTKCGILPGVAYDQSKFHILASVEASLRRLQTDYVDILVLHRPDILVEPEEVNEAFNLLLEQGKVRHFGVSNHNAMQVELLQQNLTMPLLVNQLQFSAAHTPLVDSGIYFNTSMGRGYDSFLEYSRLKNITVQAWSPYQYGFFEGTFLDNPNYPELNQTLAALGEKYSVSKGAIATAFITRHPANMQVIVGTTKASRLRDIATADGIVLTRQEWYAIFQAAGNPLI